MGEYPGGHRVEGDEGDSAAPAACDPEEEGGRERDSKECVIIILPTCTCMYTYIRTCTCRRRPQTCYGSNLIEENSVLNMYYWHVHVHVLYKAE